MAPSMSENRVSTFCSEIYTNSPPRCEKINKYNPKQFTPNFHTAFAAYTPSDEMSPDLKFKTNHAAKFRIQYSYTTNPLPVKQCIFA